MNGPSPFSVSDAMAAMDCSTGSYSFLKSRRCLEKPKHLTSVGLASLKPAVKIFLREIKRARRQADSEIHIEYVRKIFIIG